MKSQESIIGDRGKLDPREKWAQGRGLCTPGLPAGWGGGVDPGVRRQHAAGGSLIRSSRALARTPRIASPLGPGTGWRQGPEESARAARPELGRPTLRPASFLPPPTAHRQTAASPALSALSLSSCLAKPVYSQNADFSVRSETPRMRSRLYRHTEMKCSRGSWACGCSSAEAGSSSAPAPGPGQRLAPSDPGLTPQ